MAGGRKATHHFVSAFYFAGFVDPDHAKHFGQYDKFRAQGVDRRSQARSPQPDKSDSLLRLVMKLKDGGPWRKVS